MLHTCLLFSYAFILLLFKRNVNIKPKIPPLSTTTAAFSSKKTKKPKSNAKEIVSYEVLLERIAFCFI